jgi:hypothetical protein
VNIVDAVVGIWIKVIFMLRWIAVMECVNILMEMTVQYTRTDQCSAGLMRAMTDFLVEQ